MTSENNDTFPFADKEELENGDSYYEDVQLKLPEPSGGFSKMKVIVELLRNFNPAKFYRINLPIVFISPVSLIEFISKFFTPPKMVLGIADVEDPKERFLGVLKCVFLNLPRIIARDGFCHSKPYNPIIGEVYACKWEHGDSTTYCIGEQISHHPPVSSLYLHNRKSNYSLQATIIPKTKLNFNSGALVIDGEIKVKLHNHPGEVYDIVFPNILMTGLFFGKQKIVFDQIGTAECLKTGYRCDLTFNGSPKFYGTVIHSQDLLGDYCAKKELYKLYGEIDRQTFIKNLKSGESKQFIDVDERNKFIETVHQIVRPIKEQDENESRRNWHAVTKSLKDGNFDLAQTHKRGVEDVMRERRAIRKQNQVTFMPKLFIPRVTTLTNKRVKNIDDIESYKCIYENSKPYKEGEEDPFSQMKYFQVKTNTSDD